MNEWALICSEVQRDIRSDLRQWRIQWIHANKCPLRRHSLQIHGHQVWRGRRVDGRGTDREWVCRLWKTSIVLLIFEIRKCFVNKQEIFFCFLGCVFGELTLEENLVRCICRDGMIFFISRNKKRCIQLCYMHNKKTKNVEILKKLIS